MGLSVEKTQFWLWTGEFYRTGSWSSLDLSGYPVTADY
jgi:hypothetical protein